MPEQNTVSVIVQVPPLGRFGVEPVTVYTYTAPWLALQALFRMIQAEDELESLPHMEEPGADNDADLRELLRTNWSVAVLELIFLYRMHLEIQGQTLLRTFAGLLGIARAARLSDDSVFRRIHTSLEARQHRIG